MDFSKMKDKVKNDDTKGVLGFIKKHTRYFTAGTLFAVLVLVLATCAGPGQADGEGEPATEISSESGESYQIDSNRLINDLIAQYYTAYASGDVDTIAAIAKPISVNEQSYITLFSRYVESYQNIKCYTKSGLDDKSYLVSVSMEIKFNDVETVAPGLDFFYVRTDEEGNLYIDNLYSQYNLANQENALDTSVQSLIRDFENEEDVIALQKEIQEKYDAAVASDEALSAVITETIPTAISDWIATVVAQNTESVTEATEEPTEEVAETETPQETEVPEETEAPEEEPQVTTEIMIATDRVNVRDAADTSAQKLGNVEMGQKVTRTGTEGDWSIVDFNGTKGYIKSEYLRAENATAEESNTQENAPALSQGEDIRLQNTVNIRSGMSETSDRIGTAYAGEHVEVIMSYAEGWTKVSWNGQTGYIKTSLLQ